MSLFPKPLKKWLFCVALSLSGLLSAQELGDYPIFDLENVPPPLYPFSLSGQYLVVKKTPFVEASLQGHEMLYGEDTLAFAYTHPLDAENGLIFGTGWVGTTVKMTDNPEFDQDRFNYLNFSFGGFTKVFESWTWTYTLAAFLDTAELSLIDYALYQGVLWGKYTVCTWVELDFGLLVELGLKKDKVWPILGFIYLPADKWTIHAVFPIDLMLEYKWSPHITCAASIRFLRNRHRLEKEEINSQGIFQYRTTGFEGDLILSPSERFSIKAFVGYTSQGDFKVANRNNKHAHHYKFEGSPYAGVSALISF